MDVRISTLMQKWSEGAEPRVVAAARAAAADSAKVTGRHPKVPMASANIPKSCLCHASGSLPQAGPADGAVVGPERQGTGG